MISLEEFKNALDDEAKKLTEEEILKLRDNMDKMADIFFDMWLEEKRKKII